MLVHFIPLRLELLQLEEWCASLGFDRNSHFLLLYNLSVKNEIHSIRTFLILRMSRRIAVFFTEGPIPYFRTLALKFMLADIFNWIGIAKKWKNTYENQVYHYLVYF